MRGSTRRLAALAAVLGLSVSTASGQVLAAGPLPPPSTVAPGSLERPLTLSDPCPTFSWADPTTEGRIELRAVPLAEVSDIEPLGTFLPGDARTWQPESERCLERGASYAWFVRRWVEGRAGAWSQGRLLTVQESVEAASADIAPPGRAAVDTRDTTRAPLPAAAGTVTHWISVDGWPVLRAGPHSLVVPAAAFVEQNNLTHKYVLEDGQFIRAVDNGESGAAQWDTFCAPVYLPHGVTIKKIWAGFYDAEPSQVAVVRLKRVSLFDGSVVTVAEVDSSTSQPTGTYKWQNSAEFSEEVNGNHVYWLSMVLYRQHHRLHAVAITYAQP